MDVSGNLPRTRCYFLDDQVSYVDVEFYAGTSPPVDTDGRVSTVPVDDRVELGRIVDEARGA